MNKFSVVGTPIGNMEDMTLRAIRTLSEADIVLCEDTRVTHKLLSHYHISKPTLSYHAYSKLSRVEEILAMLKEGKNLAMVSDAGTPSISDPGAALVSYIRQECKAEIAEGRIVIEAIPGPSALTTALSIAGVSCADFTFLGFLPHKKGRQTLIKEIVDAKRTYIFYESPHRVLKTLKALHEYGSVSKKITICKELTKIFEQVIVGTASELITFFEENPDKLKGEFVFIVEGER